MQQTRFFRKIGKRGQFFLIAAIVIIAIVAGLTVVYNSSKGPVEETFVYDLSEEIDFEVSQVIHQGVYDGKSQEEISDHIKELTAFYAETNPDADIAIYYGNEEEIRVLFYEQEACESIDN